MHRFDCAKASAILKIAFGVVLLQAFQVAAAASSDHTLARLAAADQADREAGTNKIDWSVVGKRDAARREQVTQLLNSGEVRTAEDYFDAALIFQHGDTMQDAQLALALATVAARIDPANRDARVLAADAWDRVMTRAGKPQWYGTQYVRSKTTGKWELYPTEPDVITEAQRREIGLPTLEEDKAHLDQINK
ncbi:hypothetical protein [Dyella acidiphila]|uniref:Uncharacterized protein n=1 Tax=Dyella acidiphila TaxID=2775866 RepID=A0ABR9GER7_9GAMM|nr:hypothetical protein [Dyella acidiphila]MBE1162516.1 hypothetical protein [Dyella acidiphila]